MEDLFYILGVILGMYVIYRFIKAIVSLFK